MVKIETSRDNRTRSGQDDCAIAELGFEKAECLVKISEEGWILRVERCVLASSRNFDLNGKARTHRAKRNSPIIPPA